MDDDPLPTKIILVVAILLGMIWPRLVATSVESTVKYCSYQALYIGFSNNPFLEFVDKPKEKKYHRGFPRSLNKVWWKGNGSCVPYARYRTGIKLYGWAGTMLERAEAAGYATSSIPTIGGLVITNESHGHVAVIEDIGTSTIYISEQNFKEKYIISYRTLKLTDPRILGYIY